MLSALNKIIYNLKSKEFRSNKLNMYVKKVVKIPLYHYYILKGGELYGDIICYSIFISDL